MADFELVLEPARVCPEVSLAAGFDKLACFPGGGEADFELISEPVRVCLEMPPGPEFTRINRLFRAGRWPRLLKNVKPRGPEVYTWPFIG